MYQRKLSPKNKLKLAKLSQKTSKKLKPIPEKWSDFARLCKIRSGNKIINFEPYDYQILLSDLIDKHQTSVITKARQLGLTELIANKFLHKAAKNPAYLAVIFSKTQSDTSNIAKRLRRTIDSLEGYLELNTNSTIDIALNNGGRILFRNSTPNGARGLESVSDVLLDESAFVEGINEIYAATSFCTSMVGDEARTVILSTPNGQSGWYWEKLSSNNADKDVLNICEEMKTGKIEPIQYWIDDNNWLKFCLHWLAHPVYSTIPDYLKVIKQRFQLPDNIIEQEFNLSFLHSEETVFSAELVRINSTGILDDIREDTARYYIGVDTSNLGNDYTVAIVLKLVDDIYSVAAIYRKRKMTSDYDIYQISDLIDKYKPDKVGIEVTGGTGQVYLEQLAKINTSIRFEAIKTTKDSKPQMINRLILALEQNKLTFPSNSPIVDELLSYRKIGIKLEASQGKHDDCVMSLAFSLAVSPFKQDKKGFAFTSVPTF